ncbi:MAG: hypothetical protein JSW06_02670, partial [Thermoplasmatales archaeon]
AESTELSAEELQEKLKESELQRDATEKALEQAKRSQAGSDKAVGELKKRLDSLEKEKMTDEEKVKYAEEQAEKTKLEYETKIRELEIEKFVSEKINDIKIESRFSSLIEGKDEIAITEKTNLLLELLKTKEDSINESWRAKGGKPSGGTQMNLGDDLSQMNKTQFNDYYRSLPEDQKKNAQERWKEELKKRRLANG